MITALCINPCIDKTISIGKFVYGGMNRITDARLEGSGKGVNVALVTAALGGEGACLLALPQGGEAVEARLAQAGCHVAFVPTGGRLRVNTKVRDESTGIITELNESGAPLGADAVSALEELCLEYARRSDAAVLIGSLPKGMPPDFYGMIGERMRQENSALFLALDAEGELFRQGLRCKPDLVKPNQFELETYMGEKVERLDDVRRGACALLAAGAKHVVVTLGGEGAFASDGARAYFAPALPVEVRSTVGAGDSMLAAMTMALSAGEALRGAFIKGVAASASAVGTEGTALVDVETYLAYIEQVEIQEMAL